MIFSLFLASLRLQFDALAALASNAATTQNSPFLTRSFHAFPAILMYFLLQLVRAVHNSASAQITASKVGYKVRYGLIKFIEFQRYR